MTASVGASATSPIELSDVVAGTGGFVINGIDAADLSGASVSGAGDVNGDGLGDLIVGVPFADPGAASGAGESYVVFGKASTTAVELSAVAAGTGGFVINGIAVFDDSGGSVSGGGDVNGDGLADLIVGANGADPGGESYVVFGKASGTAVDLSTVASGTGGFVINGIDAYDSSGSVSGAGDVNGDGLADLIVGALGADPNGDSLAGESYVVFGKANGTAVELSSVASGAGGFIINGVDTEDRSGRIVSGGGDVNGDGLADLIVAASYADPGGDSEAGESYVVFGKANGTAVELSDVAAGTGGFVVNGIDPDDESGFSVSGAGDVNGDGLADLIIGARYADPPSDGDAGESYVVFGKVSGAVVELSAVAAGTGGFMINGIDSGDSIVGSVSGSGDINGDGLADLLIGAGSSISGGEYLAGESYVVFGKSSGTTVELSAVAAGTGGFIMNGIDEFDFSGGSVSGAGDVNGDGLADLIIGASGASPGGYSGAGESYVVFSPETAPASATYYGYVREGDGAGGNPVVPLEVGDSRMTIDYSDEDSADNGSGGPSLEIAILHRAQFDLTGLPVLYGSSYWEWSTDRQNWTSGTFTFKYLDSDVSGLGGPESSYVVYTATSKSGPWTAQTTTVDASRNTASITTAIGGNASFFVLSASTSYEKWVDLAWGGSETGTIALPYNTVGEALSAVSSGGTVTLKGNTADGDSAETFAGVGKIDQAVTIKANGGTVTIGNTSRNAQRGEDDAPEVGFVSNTIRRTP